MQTAGGTVAGDLPPDERSRHIFALVFWRRLAIGATLRSSPGAAAR
jgi:hypothetical protein